MSGKDETAAYDLQRQQDARWIRSQIEKKPRRGEIWHDVRTANRYVEIMKVAANEVTIRTMEQRRTKMMTWEAMVWFPKYGNRQTKAKRLRFGKPGGYSYCWPGRILYLPHSTP